MARHDRFKRSKARRVSSAAAHAVPLEDLEARLLLTAYTVTTNLDVVDSVDGLLSLREALTAANTNQVFSDAAAGQSPSVAVDTITFAPAIWGETVELLLGELPITEAARITGPAAPDSMTISGSDEMRIFNITGNNVWLSNLTVTDGIGQGGGGAIRMSGGGTLYITGCTIQNSFALSAQGSPAWGGGILNLDSTINILQTTIGGGGGGNSAKNGGAIYSQGGTIRIVGGVTIADNTATSKGAGIYMDGGTLDMTRDIPTIWIGTAHSDPEGDEGDRTVTYNVSLSHPSDLPVTVKYVVASLPGDTATAGDDYDAVSGTVTFAPGTTSALISVVFHMDANVEADETFHITLSDPVNGMIGNPQSTATIEDNLSDVSIGTTHRDFEGDTSPSYREYNVSLGNAVVGDVTVDYVVDSQPGDTATAGVDYVPISGTLTFLVADNERTKSIIVPFIGDKLPEDDESFTITLSNVTGAGAVLGNAVCQAWIENDDFASDVTDNVATDSGGGLYASDATVMAEGITFDGNSGLDGGNLYLVDSTVTFGNDVDERGDVGILGAITNGGALRHGGGVFMSGGTVTIAGGGNVFTPLGIGQVSIAGNEAISGGGIYQDDGTLSLVDASVSDNVATSTPVVGVPVSMDGVVAATADFDTGIVTGTITGTITVGGVVEPEGALGTFTTTVQYVLDNQDVGTDVLVTVTIGDTVVGTIDCILTIIPVLGTNTAEGTFTGSGLIVGSGFATFTGTLVNPPDPASDFELTMSPSAVVTGTSPIGSTGLGGGIYATNGSLTTNRVQIMGNSATGSDAGTMAVMGGGIYALYHTLRLNRTVIDDNSVEGNGGGVFLEHSDATLSQVTLGGNTATSVSGASSEPSDGSITGTITGTGYGYSRSINTIFTAGSGSQLLGVSVSGVGTGSIEGNITLDGRIVGVVTGSVTVSPMGTGSITGTVSYFGTGTGLLSATISGGGLKGTVAGSVVLAGTAFPDFGLVGGMGGGVYVTQGSTLKLDSSTVTANSAAIGGGVYVAYPEPNGVGPFADEAGDVDSHSSIIAVNTATSGDLGADVYGVITAGQTLIGRGVGSKVYGSGNLIGHTTDGIDPKFAPRDVTGGYYDLLSGSPAINTGSNPSGAMTDTRGWPRLFGAKYDMGAVEHQADIGPRFDLEIDNRTRVETYNFGGVPLDTTKAVQFTIRNEGTDVLTISEVVAADGDIFTLTPDNGVEAGDDWTILPGQTFTFTITVLPDAGNPDGSDIFTFTTSDPLRPTHVLAVNVNQGSAVPDMTVSDVTIVEGNGGTKNAVFTVSLSSPSLSTVTAQYETADGTATAGDDYIAASGLVVFAPGQTTKTVTVKVKGDKVDETDETFYLDLSNALGAAIAGQPAIPGDPDDHTHQATATIIDDDLAPTLRINDVRMNEGDAGATNFVFTLSLSVISGKPITVDWATASGTALAVSDYVADSDTLTFDPGDLTKTVTITVNGDTAYEFDDTFFVNLSGANNATIADSQGKGTIVNDDDAPTLNIDSPSIGEGTGGSTFLTFEAALSALSERPVSAKYATVGGTAVSGVDFAPASGTLVFAPGVTSQFIPVRIVTDAMDEFNETFQVKLTKPTGAVLGIAAGTGTITDDDAAPSLSINNVSVVEGDSGTRKMTFTVTLSAQSGKTVSVDYATNAITATAVTDYIPTSGTLTFAPGVTTRTIVVLIVGDTAVEANETFSVDLAAAVNAAIGDNQGIGTILNDD